MARKFKLARYDEVTIDRVRKTTYPLPYRYLYGLWVVVLLLSGFAVGGGFFTAGASSPEHFGPLALLGLINMVGAWLLVGAGIDAVLWRLSSGRFRDYVRLRLIQAHSPYEMRGQISALVKIGLIYYLILSPVIILLVVKLG